ncbi:2-C-methyl-D-erythritol 4-phosphate cytidylyltransferase [Elusimicrobiota bacterium]
MKKVAFILLAAGKGARFGASKPKQFFEMHGKPLIFWSLKSIAKHSFSQVVITLPKEYLHRKKGLIGRIHKTVECVAGGDTRWQSLRNAMKKIRSGTDFVFVHDGARPNFNQAWLAKMLTLLKSKPTFSTVIPVVSLRDTVKLNHGKLKTFAKRELLCLAQTPQLSKVKDLLEAIKKIPGRVNVLDEGQAMEKIGKKSVGFKGSPTNIKITFPEDFAVAKILRKGRS